MIIQVGNLYPDTPRFKNRTMGRVYDPMGLCPTINTNGGGGREPMIVVYEDRQAYLLEQQGGGVQPSLQDRIYDVEGCSTAITTSFLPSIAEPIICAMRGRNPDNPSERAKSNGRYRQRLEMNDKGTSNTITSVQKDNLVVEPQVLTPKRTEFGKAIRKQYESHEIEMSRHDMTTMEPRTDGVSNTLTSAQKDNYLAIPEATSKGYAEAYEGDSVNLAVPNSKTRRGRVGKQMANTLDTGCQQGVVEQENSVRYRIRKLTPRECFRLMGVDDVDIDKIQGAGISNSQQYKMAGNSIIVDTLYYIIRKLFVDKGCEKEGHQQSLF